MTGLLFGYPSISELMRCERLGIGFLVHDSLIRAGSCVPDERWVRAVADWMLRGFDSRMELSVHGPGCTYSDADCARLLAQMPERIRDLFSRQPLSRVLCCNQLSSPSVQGLPCHYRDSSHCAGMLGMAIEEGGIRVALFFFQPPALRSQEASHPLSAAGSTTPALLTSPAKRAVTDPPSCCSASLLPSRRASSCRPQVSALLPAPASCHSGPHPLII